MIGPDHIILYFARIKIMLVFSNVQNPLVISSRYKQNGVNGHGLSCTLTQAFG